VPDTCTSGINAETKLADYTRGKFREIQDHGRRRSRASRGKLVLLFSFFGIQRALTSIVITCAFRVEHSSPPPPSSEFRVTIVSRKRPDSVRKNFTQKLETSIKFIFFLLRGSGNNMCVSLQLRKADGISSRGPVGRRTDAHQQQNKHATASRRKSLCD
jgi:hypothetical protein